MRPAIKQFFWDKKPSSEILGILIWFTFCLILIATKRNIFPQSPPRSFLVNNLFLGAIPYFISLISLKFFPQVQGRKIRPLFGLTFILWLIFLPNSLYLFTDIVHLEELKTFSYYILEVFSFPYWLDLIIFVNFGLLSFYLGLLSIFHWHILLRQYSRGWRISLLNLAFLLVGMGVYLGRFIRLFSWQAFGNPLYILMEIQRLASYPYALIFCLSLSGTYAVAYFLFFGERLQSQKKSPL